MNSEDGRQVSDNVNSGVEHPDETQNQGQFHNTIMQDDVTFFFQ